MKCRVEKIDIKDWHEGRFRFRVRMRVMGSCIAMFWNVLSVLVGLASLRYLVLMKHV